MFCWLVIQDRGVREDELQAILNYLLTVQEVRPSLGTTQCKRRAPLQPHSVSEHRTINDLARLSHDLLLSISHSVYRLL